MASTFSTNLAIELIGTGDQAGTWGTTTNSNLGTLIEQAISGYVTQAVATGTDTTITIPNGSTGVARNMYIELTGTGGASTNLIVPANKKLYFIFNNSTGAVTVKVSGQTGVSVPTGKKMVLVSNGTDIVNGLNYIADFGTNSFSVTNLTASSATITNLIATSGSITNLVSSDASATVLRAGSATLTHLSATSASITNLSLTSLTISSLSITNVSVASATVSSNLTLSGGTANGVLYLNGSKVATSGSALTFDGTILTSNTGAFTTLGVISSASTAAFSSYVRPANNKNIYFREATAVGGSLTGALIQGATNNAAAWAALSFGATEYEWGISGSEAMRLTSTGLGIGTTSPGNKLVVNGSSGTTQIQLADSTATNNLILGVNTSTVDIKGVNGFPMAFYTANAERMRLDTSGNLGIGTASPASKLTVSGDVHILSTNYLNFTNTAQQTYIRAPASNTIAFGTSNTEQMRLDSSGNLGIGTSLPAFALGSGLEVERAGIATLRLENSSGSNGIEIAADSTTNGIRFYGLNNAPFVFAPNATERMRITSDGKVGIASTNPGVDLQIGSDTSTTRALSVRYSSVPLYLSGGFDGTNALNTFSANAYANATGSGQSWTSFSNTSYGASAVQLASSPNGADIRFLTAAAANTNPTERARITSGGELLVGTTSSSYGAALAKMDVNGGSTAGMVVTTSAGASYGNIYAHNTATSGDNVFVDFGTEGTWTTRGSITYNRAGGLVAYNTTSDYRAKNIIGPVQDSGATIDALKVYEGQMKGATQSRPMLVAHEAQEHAPYAVTGEKDAVNEDGTPKYQQMDVSALVPLLLAEIQSLRARVAQLESK
jgi:hypothetical protein